MCKVDPTTVGFFLFVLPWYETAKLEVYIYKVQESQWEGRYQLANIGLCLHSTLNNSMMFLQVAHIWWCLQRRYR